VAQRQAAIAALALLLGLALATGPMHASARPAASGAERANTRRFGIWKDQFLKDGLPFQIISGSIHYHRCWRAPSDLPAADAVPPGPPPITGPPPPPPPPLPPAGSQSSTGATGWSAWPAWA
jgi:hypothetical protein